MKNLIIIIAVFLSINMDAQVRKHLSQDTTLSTPDSGLAIISNGLGDFTWGLPSRKVVIRALEIDATDGTFSLDNSVTWDSVKTAYDIVEFRVLSNVSGVGQVCEVLEVPTSFIVNAMRIRPEYGSSLTNIVLGVTTGGTFTTSSTLIIDFDIEILGIKE